LRALGGKGDTRIRNYKATGRGRDPSGLSSSNILSDDKYWFVEPHGLLISKDPYSFHPSPSVPWLTNLQCRVAKEGAVLYGWRHGEWGTDVLSRII